MSKAIGNALSRQILDIASWGESNCCYGRVLRDASLVSHGSLEFGLLKILDMKAAEIRAQHGPLENLTQQSTLLSALRGENG